METELNNRPFDNFRLAINDPDYFFGRRELLEKIEKSPLESHILLGGRRIGVTSVLNIIQWNLLNADNNLSVRSLPVLLDLRQKQPDSLDNFRYILIERLKETINNLQQKQNFKSKFKQNIGRLINQIAEGGINLFGIELKVNNPAQNHCLNDRYFRQDLLNVVKVLQKKQCDGICFLIDGAEEIVQQNWSNDAWSYLRSLKENNIENINIASSLGWILSGYRNLKEYQQKVGSKLLDISRITWLTPLTKSDTSSLIISRYKKENLAVTQEKINFIVNWAGCHPYLTQQMINVFCDNQYSKNFSTDETLIEYLIRRFDDYFSLCWDNQKASYGFSKIEQKVYLALVKQRERTARTLAAQTQLNVGETRDALKVITGNGFILELDQQNYAIGAKLFEKWVAQEIR